MLQLVANNTRCYILTVVSKRYRIFIAMLCDFTVILINKLIERLREEAICCACNRKAIC